MKKGFTVLIVILAAFANMVNVSGQGFERIRSEKIAFFTRRLSLTSEEAEKFWPVYNDFSNRKQKLNQDMNSLVKYASQNYSNLSVEELEEAGDKIIDFQTSEAALAKEYHEKFKKVLPPEKVILLYATEVQFNSFLLNQLQERRQQQAPLRRIP
jgi:hypothetical protein